MPPILWSLVEFARHRRLDALSVLVVCGIALSLLAMLGGGGARFLQLREKLVTGLIGLAFVGSALIGKPLVYELARATMRRKSENEAREFEALQVHAGFRRTMTVMTLVWGSGSSPTSRWRWCWCSSSAFANISSSIQSSATRRGAP